MTASAVKPFVIPTGDELAAIIRKLTDAEDPLEGLRLGLLHATDGVEEPLRQFAEQPTFENIGALFSFATYAADIGKYITEYADAIIKMLPAVEMARVEWPVEDGDDA